MQDLYLIHELLSIAEVYISLGTFAFVLLTYLFVKRRQRVLERKILDEFRGNPGSKPAVFILDLYKSGDIKHDVVGYMSQNAQLKDIGDDRIVVLSDKDLSCGNNISPENIQEFLGVLQRKENELRQVGFDVIHYFHGGPAMIAALIGARWGNQRRVDLYQHTPGIGYQNWGPLRYFALES